MRFRIRHVSSYRYERPVRLGPHALRMQPHGAGIRLEAFRYAIYPRPTALEAGFDEAGNPVHTARFDAEAAEFRVAMHVEGDTAPTSPMPLAPATLPPFYGEEIETLWRYRISGEVDADGEVAELAGALALGAAGDAGIFLASLSRALWQRVRNVSRLTGAPLAPEITLRERQGSCRDFAVLFVACCRLQGLAARFVSGYIPAPAGESQHMHAWAEAHVPGVGWTAWDPTQGGLAGESHIRVAASAEPADAAPITGSYAGASPSELEVELRVEVGEASA